MTRSITLTIEKRRLEFDGVRNKGNTDLFTFRPHNDLHRFPPLKYPNVNQPCEYCVVEDDYEAFVEWN